MPAPRGRRLVNPLCKTLLSTFHSQSQSFSASPSALQRILCNHVAGYLDLKRAHCSIIVSGHSTNPFLAAKLISLYSDFNSTHLSNRVFSSAISRYPTDTFLWNSIVKAHLSDGDYPPVLGFYREMRKIGASPDHFTPPLVLSACAELTDLGSGSCIHGDFFKLGLLGLSSSAGVSSLLYMYFKCEKISPALKLFDEMPQRDIISWTTLVVGCAANGHPMMAMGYLREMHRSSIIMNSRAIVAGIGACASVEALSLGKCLHALAMKLNSWLVNLVKSSFLSLYSKCGSLSDALAVSREIDVKDLVSWTEILSCYAKLGFVRDCAMCFVSMMDAGLKPDGVSVSSLLSSISNEIILGEALHGFLLRRYLLSERIGVIALINMYFRLKLPSKAMMMFEMVDDVDGELWVAVISSSAKIESGSVNCLELFRKMQLTKNRTEYDIECVMAAISTCSTSKHLCFGLALHAFCIKNEFHGMVSVSNSLVGMYGKLQKADYSRKIFNGMNNKDIVTWNTFMGVLLSCGKSKGALELFDQIVSNRLEANSATMIIALSACAAAVDLDRGEVVHGYIRDNGFCEDISVSTALMDMYAKCGKLLDARRVFDAMSEKDVATWNAMICGYGSHGYAKEALEIMEKMVGEGWSPNEITFTAVLSACSRAGLVEEGRRLFGKLGEFSLKPSRIHITCMVDMLGRSGLLEEAEAVAMSEPTADSGVWGALLGACMIHGEVEMGERAGKKAVELDPYNDGYFMVLSNLYISMGKKDEADGLRKMMVQLGVRKTAGWSMT